MARFGMRWSLKSIPAQTVPWFSDSKYEEKMEECGGDLTAGCGTSFKRRDEFLSCSTWDGSQAVVVEERDFSVWTELIFPGKGRRIVNYVKI